MTLYTQREIRYAGLTKYITPTNKEVTCRLKFFLQSVK